MINNYQIKRRNIYGFLHVKKLLCTWAFPHGSWTFAMQGPLRYFFLLQTYVQVQLTVQTPDFSISLTFFIPYIHWSIVLPSLKISSELWLLKSNLQVLKYKYLLSCRFVQSGTIGNIIIFPTNFPKYFRQRYISAPCCLERVVGG